MTATITRPKLKKSVATKKESPYKRLHVIIPIEDMLWASQQKPSVNQLWQECWTADPYGSRWMPLTSTLGYSTFISAKKILSDSGLFIFKPDKSIQDGRETVAWMVKNLHGSRMKEFWEKANAEKREPNSEKRELNAEISDKDADSEEIGALYKASILGQSQSEQRLQETSQTVQEHLTNSSKEFVRCVSDTLTGNSREEETAHAPLGVASPQTVESVSEKEEDSPTANDCTRVTLLDDAQGESALLLAENQDCGIEQKGCHVRVASRREGGYSAAPVAQNEECLSSAMSNDKPFHVYANQTPELVEQGNSAPLLVENSVSGVEVKAAHEGQSSVAPVLNPEKWSHEAIVARSNVDLVKFPKPKNRSIPAQKNPPNLYSVLVMMVEMFRNGNVIKFVPRGITKRTTLGMRAMKRLFVTYTLYLIKNNKMEYEKEFFAISCSSSPRENPKFSRLIRIFSPLDKWVY